MVNSTTLGKIGLCLMFPVVGMGYFVQNRVKKGFADRPWYNEAIDLLKGYKPALDRLGEPIVIKRIDVSDAFNYTDSEMARAKIPVKGQKNNAHVFVYAKCEDNKQWKIDYLEIMYDSTKQKYKFYDGNLKKDSK